MTGRIHSFESFGTVDGPGIRFVVFLQGCPHRCLNCHNQDTWDANGGKHFEVTKLAAMFKDSPNDITISGGEPLMQLEEVIMFMECIRRDNPNKRFWLYTGYSYELIEHIVESYLALYIDVLVDGRFVDELKDSNLPYRGSSNQRLIDVKKTIESGHIVLWEVNHEA